MTQKTASPELVKVSDLAKELEMDEFTLRLVLLENKVADGDETESITAQQAQAVRVGHKAYITGADVPQQDVPKPQGGAIAVQSNSQLEQISRESQQLSAGVITILQELGVKQKLVEGHQQGSLEVAAFEAGRSGVWEGYAQEQIQIAKQTMGDRQAFNVNQALKDLGITLPGDRLSGLNQKTSSTLDKLRKAADECTSSPWSK